MAKLKLTPNPTFVAKVGIPVPGGEIAQVEFTFRWRGRAEFVEWVDAARDKTFAEAVADMATGWNLDDEFTPANIERLCDTYAGAGSAVFNAYADELRGARTKN